MNAILRETLIHHALARDTIAVRNMHGEDDCVVLGRVTKVGPNHIVIVGRGHESSIPIAKISDVKLLDEGDEREPTTAPVVPGVTE